MIQVLSVAHAGDFKLDVEFDDGTSGVADLGPLFERSELFAPLRDPAAFARAYVEDGTVCWSGELDLATERLYALVHGLPMPSTYEQSQANESTVRERQSRTDLPRIP